MELEVKTDSENGGSARFSRWQKILGGMLGAAILLLTLLPFGVEWGLEYALRRQGAERAEIADVDLNLFVGRLRIEDLRALRSPPDSGRLEVDLFEVQLGWWPLMRKRVVLERLVLDGMLLDLHQRADGGWLVGPLVWTPGAAAEESGAGEPVTEEADEAPSGWSFGIDELDLDRLRVHFVQGEGSEEFSLTRGEASEVASWSPDRSFPIDLDLQLAGGRLAWKGSARPFAERPTLSGKLSLEKLALKRLTPFVATEPLQEVQGEVGADLQLDIAVDPGRGEAEGRIEGEAGIDRLTLAIPGLELERADAHWEGELGFTLAGSAAVQGGGTVQVGALALRLPEQSLKLAQERLQAKFSFALDPEGAGGLSLQGDAGMERVRIDEEALGLNLATLEELHLEQAQLTADGEVEAVALRLSEARLLEYPKGVETVKGFSRHALGFSEVLLEGPRWRPEGAVLVALLRLSGFEGQLLVDESGEPALAPWLEPRGEQTATASPAWEENGEKSGAPRGEKMRIQVDDVAVAGKSGLVLVDRSISPPVRLQVAPLSLQGGSFDTAAPDQESSVALEAGLGRYARLELGGTVKPFAEPLGLDLDGQLSGFDLTTLAPYAEKHADLRLKSGQLEAHLDWEVDQGTLGGSNELLLSKLQVESAGDKGVFDKLLGMPLDSALSLLRDRNGDIELNLPLEGDVADPQFKVHKVLLKATRGALQKGAVSYFAPLGAELLTGVVLPPGTLFLAGKLVEMATALRFDPVLFEPLDLEPQNPDYLERMAELLADRPETRLILCGKATLDDLQALRAAAAEVAKRNAPGNKEEKPGGREVAAPPASPPSSPEDLARNERELLLDYARRRAEAVKARLTGQGGIAPDRLILCSPEIELDERAPPRVEAAI